MDLSREMVKTAFKAADEKLAIDIKVIDISEISSVADYFMICSGNNVNQVQAISDNISEHMLKAGYDEKATEGYRNANWILIDYKDVVVHIFKQEDREFYNIERIWRDGKLIDNAELKAE